MSNPFDWLVGGLQVLDAPSGAARAAVTGRNPWQAFIDPEQRPEYRDVLQHFGAAAPKTEPGWDWGDTGGLALSFLDPVNWLVGAGVGKGVSMAAKGLGALRGAKAAGTVAEALPAVQEAARAAPVAQEAERALEASRALVPTGYRTTETAMATPWKQAIPDAPISLPGPQPLALPAPLPKNLAESIGARTKDAFENDFFVRGTGKHPSGISGDPTGGLSASAVNTTHAIDEGEEISHWMQSEPYIYSRGPEGKVHIFHRSQMDIPPGAWKYGNYFPQKGVRPVLTIDAASIPANTADLYTYLKNTDAVHSVLRGHNLDHLLPKEP